MLLQKIKEKGVDLYILIKYELQNFYEVYPYMNHADDNSFQLVIRFEDWTNIINDGKEHIQTIAEYRNAEDSVLCKWIGDTLDEVLDQVKQWNDNHRI